MQNPHQHVQRQGLWLLILMFALLMLQLPEARAERIKDLAGVAGVRSNQLVGYGLVVGLDRTGDQTNQATFTVQALINMLERLGVTIPPGTNLQLQNIAAVAVTADLPPFSKPGQNLDVTVSSIANAKSLRGGTLIATVLKGVDGQVYAVAQGNLVVGGLASGATVERAVPAVLGDAEVLTLNLNTPDFTTATRLAEGINQSLGAGTAQPVDPMSVQVRAPQSQSDRVAFISVIENLEVSPGEAPARVIVNSRTGTVVISSRVQVLPAAVSHGSLAVSITEDFDVSQPEPFSRTGETVVTPQTRIEVAQADSRMFLFKAGVDLNEIVQAVNQVGAAPGDLVAILEALRSAGALRAQLIVI
jgi:flagellar P-ring protein FlgI